MKYLITFLLISTPCYAEWTTQDTAFQTVFVSTLFIDAWQTYTFLYTKDYREQGYYETCEFLGEYPSRKRLFTYFTIYAITYTAITYIIPKPYRTFWQLIWIGYESKAVYHNYNIGVRINLP